MVAKRTRSILAGMIVLLVFAAFASAGPLTGIIAVGILIEAPNDALQRCGVSEDALDAAVRLPLAASRLRFHDALGHPYIYVNATAVMVQGMCIAHVEVSLNRALMRETERVRGYVWSKGALMVGEASGFKKRVTDYVEGFTKEFIAAWLKDNP